MLISLLNFSVVGFTKEWLNSCQAMCLKLFSEPNAGRPELVDGKAVYMVSTEDFAAAAEKIHSEGVTIIGGCCGTGPEHIEAVVKELKKY